MSSKDPSNHSEFNDSPDIAIIGMAGRFPGARNVAEFWQNIRNGVESIRPLTQEELLQSGVDPSLLERPNYVKAGGPLADVALFDALFFGFSPKDAAVMDPQHRHFMECCWEALEHAAHPPAKFAGQVGVFAGCGMNAYFMRNILTNPELMDSVGLFLLRHTGNDRDFLPTTVSYKLNLRGPSVAIQTACSTSLVAIHMACQSLLNGECDMALAGGVTIQVPHGQGYLYRPNEVLSPDGHCRAFDARSAGTVITNGAGVVVLRRLGDALKDNDYIHAVIKGSAINNDGSNKIGYLAPSVDGHAAVVAEALALADLSADDISYLEAHGTGTAVGDPIEIVALTEAFRQTSDRQGFCPIGSVKTNIGHLDTAAGVAGVIKVVEALKHKEIPPSLHFEEPNPNIDFAHSPFFVNATLRAWNSQGPRRAGISSLGVGGTNAHVILEEAPAPVPTVHKAAPTKGDQRQGANTPPQQPWQLLTLSAKTPTALDTATQNLAQALAASPDLALADVAFTLQEGREDFEYRRILVSNDLADASVALLQKDPKRVFSGKRTRSTPSVTFLFPGGGTQYPNMGRELYETESVYRQEVDRCLVLLKPLVNFDLRSLMFPAPGSEAEAAKRLRDVCPSICAIFITEYALAKLWMAWGIQPSAMTGHSLGEYTAACLTGVISLADALAVVVLRGNLVAQLSGAAMLSVPLPEAELRELLGDDLDLAAINGPSFCLVSGLSPALDRLEAQLAERGLDSRRLHVNGASHCRWLDPILPEFRAAIAQIKLQKPKMPYISNVTGDWIRPEDATDPDYWVKHFRQTVRFSDGLSLLLAQQPDTLLLEVGPGNALGSLARQQSAKPVDILASLPRHDDPTPARQYLLTTVGRMWLHGVVVGAHLRGSQPQRRIPLPTYPFERQHFWIDPPQRLTQPATPPLEIRKQSNLDDWFYTPEWRPAPPFTSDSNSAALAPQGSPQKWVLFLDEMGLGASIRDHLESQGHQVVTLRAGDSFHRVDERQFIVPPELGREPYDFLVETLAAEDRLPTRVLHLWLASVDNSFRPGSSLFHTHMERGFYSLLFLAQALAAQDLPGPEQMIVVSNDMQAVQESLLFPDKSTVLGPILVIPHEIPGIACRSVDLSLKALHALNSKRERTKERERLVASLLSELGAAQPQEQVTHIAWRAGERWALAYRPLRDLTPQPLQSGSPATSLRLRQGGTYLITGGLSGVGLEVAEYLSRQYQARLVLLSRRQLPPRQEWDAYLAQYTDRDPIRQTLQKILAMEQAGAQVLVVAADVANIQEMQEVLAKIEHRFGSVQGVIHAAGLTEDAVLSMKTPESMDRVFAPKVQGTMVLAKVLAAQPLDFCVLFSSISSILGPAGQVDYAAANAFLDAFAQSNPLPKSCYTVAVNWGVWKGIGQATGIQSRLLHRASSSVLMSRRTSHPMLQEWVEDSAAKSVFWTTLHAKQQWMLDEHRLKGGQALIPGTGYLEIIRAAAQETFGVESFVAHPLVLNNVNFIAPLAVSNTLNKVMQVELTRQDPSSFAFEISSKAEEDSQWILNAQGSGQLVAQTHPAPLDLEAVRQRCHHSKMVRNGRPLVTSQATLVEFGPRWNCLREVLWGDQEAIATVELSADFVADLEHFALHPALLDIATGFGLNLIKGYGSKPYLYVPASYQTLRVYAPLTRTLFSIVRSDPANSVDRPFAVFEVILTDEGGNYLVEVQRFSMKRMSPDSLLSVNPSPSAASPSAAASPQPPSLSEGERLFLETYQAGIEPLEGMQILERIINYGRQSRLVVSPVALDTLMLKTGGVNQPTSEQAGIKFARPNLQTEYEAPRDEMEKTLSGFWAELLGVEQVGMADDFFALGGHSLIAVRLFARIHKHFNVEYPLSTLFDAPTIRQFAQLLRNELGQDNEVGEDNELGGEAGSSPPREARSTRRWNYLVPLNTPAQPKSPPFFLVAGMFGNVLNLRHLATHLGDDRVVYAVQAKGLYGDDRPHDRFPDMARDYLQEIRQLQPEGPYFLGGFSGGGITAFEMAQQLVKAGQQVGSLVMLDAFPTELATQYLTGEHLSGLDRLSIHAQRILKRGPRYLTDWAKDRIAWELSKFQEQEAPPTTPAEFRSEEIRAAFVEAIRHYRTEVYPGKAILFRPPLDRAYALGGGRIASEKRELVDPANHWSPYVAGGVEVFEVIGDHDSMVLEPNVRVLARQLKICLKEAEKNARTATKA